MNAVTLALVSLKDLGKITRVHEGRGRDPHRYKILKAGEALDAEITDADIREF